MMAVDTPNIQFKMDSNGVQYAYDPDNDILYALIDGAWVIQDGATSPPFQVSVTGVGNTGKSSLAFWLVLGVVLVAVR